MLHVNARGLVYGPCLGWMANLQPMFRLNVYSMLELDA